jgi:hypothetical protein
VSLHRPEEVGSAVLSFVIFVAELSSDMKASDETEVIPSRTALVGLMIPLRLMNWKPEKEPHEGGNHEESENSRADPTKVSRGRRSSEVAAQQESRFKCKLW